MIRDRDIREALIRKELRRHRNEPNTLIVQELGLRHGAARVDIAVVNGAIHGYEIKSPADTLDRLAGQVAEYRGIFDKVTMVCAERHVAKAKRVIPTWWAIKIAVPGARGAIHFEIERRGHPSPEIDTLSVARLLWRDEVLSILAHVGLGRGLKSKTREALYSLMAERLPRRQLLAYVRDTLKVRQSWRPDALRT